MRCSVCSSAVFIPNTLGQGIAVKANAEAAAWIRVACACGKVIKGPPNWAGKKGNCPRCGTEVIMPPVREGAEDGAPSMAVMAAATFGSSNAPPLAGTEGLSDVQLSGLIDLTSSEDVKIIDGVAPALWDAKRDQRAKAMRAGSKAQVRYYRRRAFTEQLADVRKWIDEVLYRRPAWTMILSIAALGVSLMMLYFFVVQFNMKASWSAVPTEVYFYDLNASKLFVHLDSDPPPIKSPSQTDDKPKGVRAYVFSCGKCEDLTSLYVGYLETFDPQTDAGEQFKKFRTVLASGGPSLEATDAENKAEAGRLISGPQGTDWGPADSENGQKIVSEGTKACATGKRRRLARRRKTNT